MNITIIDGHPDPSPDHLIHALADRYANAAHAAGHEVRRIDVSKLDFSLMRDPKEFVEGHPSESIVGAQRKIAWADHVALFFPLWMTDMPALLKAFFEQTFRPGFALDTGGKRRFPRRLLKGRSGRIVVTMGMPAFAYRALFGAHSIKMLESLFKFAGFGPVESTVFGSVEDAKECTKQGWFVTMDRLAHEDASRRPRRAAALARTVATAGVLAAAGYMAYAAASWARYGVAKPAKEPDTLLDRFMSNYEVGLRHAIVVHAPAAEAYATIRATDFERAPLVRFLFGMREMLMRAKPEEPAPATLPFDQLTSLGWSLLAEEDGREIVLGTVTKPWQPNTRFRPLRPDDFAAFAEPGFAKIALMMRVDPVSSEHCEVRTETRVQTTDPISRARFRRYWAFLSPGMAIIRRVLLQQIKAEAESAWEKTRPITDVTI